MINKEQLDALAREFRGPKATNMFASLNLTVPQRISGSRAQMVSGHLEQAVMLEKPETPRMFTGFELPYGKYTDSYYKTESPLRVVDVVQKFQHKPGWIYVYIVQNMVDGTYDVIEVSHVEKLSEMHGYIKPMSTGDMFQPGSIIPPNTVIVKSNNHDEYGNYRYGINAKVAYMSISEVEEDAQYISKSFSERVRFTTMEDAEASLNINDVLLNIYGNEEVYRCIPDLGEEIKDGIVFVKRNIDHKNIAGDFTRTASRNIQMDDQIYSGKGIVVDIDIHVNDKNELVSSKHRSQLMLYYNSIFNYYTRLRMILSKIKSTRGNKFTYKLVNLLQQSKDYLDADTKFSSTNGVFEFALLKITTAKSNSLGTGFKMTDRYGAKGVISAIVDDELMPKDEFGNIAEIVLSPPGIPSRANIFQNYEHEMNYVESHVRKLIAKEPSIERKYKYLIKFLRRVSPKEAGAYEEYWASIPPMEKINEMMEIANSGIYIHQAPFYDNISYENLIALYKDWDIKPGIVRMRREFRESSQAFFKYRQKMEKPKYTVVHDVSFDQENVANIKDIENTMATPYSQNIETDEDGRQFIIPDEEVFSVPGINGKTIEYETISVPKIVERSVSEKETFTFIDDKNRFVRDFQCVNRVVIAEKYMLILKHIPEGKFSSRSLGSINSMGLPNKTGRSESGGPYSSTAVRFGEMELYNSLIRVPEEIVHRFLAQMATNPEFHNKLIEAILTGDPFEAPDLNISDEDIKNDIPVRQLVAYLFGIGLEIEQTDHQR